MISTKEKKEWILNNCIDRYGDINLNDLDFSDFDGNVNLSGMKVKGNLKQNFQKVEGDLQQFNQVVKGNLQQCSQKVEGDLNQANQKVKGDLWQSYQNVKGSMYLQDTSNLSKCTNSLGIICYREIPEMTLEEIERELGYKFKLKETEK